MASRHSASKHILPPVDRSECSPRLSVTQSASFVARHSLDIRDTGEDNVYDIPLGRVRLVRQNLFDAPIAIKHQRVAQRLTWPSMPYALPPPPLGPTVPEVPITIRRGDWHGLTFDEEPETPANRKYVPLDRMATVMQSLTLPELNSVFGDSKSFHLPLSARSRPMSAIHDQHDRMIQTARARLMGEKSSQESKTSGFRESTVEYPPGCYTDRTSRSLLESRRGRDFSRSQTAPQSTPNSTTKDTTSPASPRKGPNLAQFEEAQEELAGPHAAHMGGGVSPWGDTHHPAPPPTHKKGSAASPRKTIGVRKTKGRKAAPPKHKVEPLKFASLEEAVPVEGFVAGQDLVFADSESSSDSDYQPRTRMHSVYETAKPAVRLRRALAKNAVAQMMLPKDSEAPRGCGGDSSSSSSDGYLDAPQYSEKSPFNFSEVTSHGRDVLDALRKWLGNDVQEEETVLVGAPMLLRSDSPL